MDPVSTISNQAIESLTGMYGDYLLVIGGVVVIVFITYAYMLVTDFFYSLSHGYSHDDLDKEVSRLRKRDVASSRVTEQRIRGRFDGSRYEGQL
jgi:hypothetical protein